ncbi:MAG: glycosyltransferase [Nocardioides sp.]
MSEPACRLRALAVVVPAHNEQDLLGRCLVAVAESVEMLTSRYPDLVVLTVVVLDRCRDRSGEIARLAGARTLAVNAGAVGPARRAGVDWATSLIGRVPPESVWIANTDADSVVPVDWLVRQVAAAEVGDRLVVGAVLPDPEDLPPATHAAWRILHRSPGVGAHVHGANLGFTLDAYRAVDGFSAVAEHEDRILVDSLLSLGVTPQPGAEVLTSGRRHGRAPGGFSRYLRELQRTLDLVDARMARGELG